MADYSVVGKRMPKIDGKELVCGTALFTEDISLPKMLHGEVLHSPVPHAKILNIDTSRALKLPGVKAVISGRDIAPVKFGCFRKQPDQYAIAIDKVRYVGDDVAAVAALDEDTAQEALELIKVDYEELPAVFDPEEAMKEGAPIIHEGIPLNASVNATVNYGDVERGFKEADHIREDRFETSAIAHCMMEPYVAVASYDPSGKLDVWSPNQSPFVKRRVLANTLQIPLNNVRVHNSYIGGAFGGRSEMIALDFCAALLSMKTLRPVKITYSREETFASTRQKHPMIVHLKTGVKKDGSFVAKKFRVIADGGAYNSTSGISVFFPLVCHLAVYRTPHLRYEGYHVYTNKPVRGAMRGQGNQQIRFADESQIDMIADDLGLDPAEMRLKNAVKTGDVLLNGTNIYSCGLGESIERAARAISWKKKRAGQAHLKRGVGLACSTYVSGYDIGPRTGSSAFVKFNEDGSATVISGLVDNGQGNYNLLAQIAAEALGLKLDDIKVVAADTEITPQDPGTYTMAATYVSGNAARLAALDARRQLLEVAARKLEASPEDLEARDGMIYVKGSPAKSMSISKAVTLANLSGDLILGKGNYQPKVDPIDWVDGKIDGQSTGAFTFGTSAAEVEVDIRTGRVRIIKAVAAHDCGYPINPMLVEGQLEGAALMAQGQALSEELTFEEGNIFNVTFTDYKMPISLDAPPIETIIVESKDPNGPYGGKSAAETAGVATIPAIANAIYDAIGVRINSVPITPEKILKALEGKGKK